MTWDVTVPDTYADSHVDKTVIKPGVVANKAAHNKIDKYSRLASTHIYPFAIETAGTWHDMAIELMHKRLAGASSSSSQRTPGKQHSCFNACPWLFKGEMWSPFRNP